MSSDEVDGPGALSEDADGTLDTVERAMAELVAAPAVPVFIEGTHVGRYVLDRRLGAGAMGVVWAAHDPQLDRTVALKLLRRGASGLPGSQAADRAAREARALARLVHPNIVAVYDGGLDGDAIYVVMELVDGVTLRAWLAAELRSLDAIVDAFVQAGTGLAAAHDAKVVHRDFKPDNVLVGADGRVRVADFGLARIAGAADALSDAPSPSTTPAPTATAALAGTPAYMAPEQMAPGSVDHRADQFAFAVSWWGALYGGEPFAGDTFAERRAAIVSGPKPRAGGRNVPAWLVAILRRALSADPDARFPSMRALLAAVARGRARRRRFVTAAAAVVGVAAIVLAIWWSRSATTATPCEGGTAVIAQVWSPERAAAIADMFPPSAAGVAAAGRAGDRFDAYARDWAGGHRAACRATTVDRAQSADLLERRMVCLDRARARLDALLTWLPRAGVGAAEDVHGAIDDLPDLAHCADVGALAALVAQPADPEARARVAAATTRVDELQASVRDPTRQVRSADTAAALDVARAAGWAPLIAEAAWVHGNALYLEADVVASEAMYLAAVGWALEGADDHMATRAMAELAWMAGERKGADARSWVALARSMAHRLGDPPALALQVTTTASEVARHLGAADEAIAEATAALALASAPGAAPGAFGRALTNVGLAERAAGRYDVAIEHLEAAVEAARIEVGADHPLVADRLRRLALTLVDAGRLPDARAASERSLAIREAWYAPDHLKISEALQLMGTILQALGELDAARTSYARARAIVGLHPNADATIAVELEANLAIVDAEAGHHAVAVERGGAVLAGLEQLYGPDDPVLLDLLVGLGFAERHLGHLELSSTHLERAIRIGEPTLGGDHPLLARPRLELGLTELARGRTREAITQLERVVAAGARDPNVDPRIVADAERALADAHTGP